MRLNYVNQPERAIEYVKRNHNTQTGNSIVRRAVVGSAPIWGACSRFEFPKLGKKIIFS